MAMITEAWVNPYYEELELVFAEASDAVSRFPGQLASAGLAYMNKFNPLLADSTNNYICYLLPYWIRDTSGIPLEQCRKLSIANVFGMLHYFLLDDVIDAPSVSQGVRTQLALGSLLYEELLERYRELFPSTSPFWTYAKSYTTEWAEGTVNESSHNYFITSPISVAKKSAPLKMSSTGALLLGGQESLVAELSQAVDCVLLALQMCDDWADWEEDLQDGSYNSLIAMVGAEYPGVEVDAQLVRNAIYVKGILGRYVAVLREEALLFPSSTRLIELFSYYQYLVRYLSDHARSTQNNLQRLKHGGLHMLLSNLGESSC
ncbi:hypothetical protein ACFO9Q_22520 [Paenibacillus sp. GCM10023252]|uniref:hypothetical protein n=1 Tax=Paenibacillus sp. GCM10023252 TaxID=3252649 RepID=UPI003606A9D1